MNKLSRVSALIACPGVAFASDPTPLFVVFIAWPTLAASIALFLMVFFKRRNALTINLAFLLWHGLIIAWALDTSYMTLEGEWVWASLSINVFSIVYWLFMAYAKNERGGPEMK